ncbi:Peptidoglycan-associated lipoprotein [Vibrio stylophorae]|uniref:Peptidoglycan-associated lipoprotein n=1 Tax=Vibrio stylophorae TaxID=659351 RepID=A0ABN8DZ71_9VIBR|nr:OmpA family protein [Vibrio stylophorae]CAH0535618.1 Peptidoglycan-associated lipoprotein [Vibrio stylophorae]
MRSRHRNQGGEAPENHERWLVSYADYMTLLFALFVVLYAFAMSEKGSTQSMVNNLIASLQQSGLIAGTPGNPIFSQGTGISGTQGNPSPMPEKINLRPIQQPLPTASQNHLAQDSKDANSALVKSLTTLRSILKNEIKNHEVEVEQLGQQLRIRVTAPILFAADSEYLQPKFDPLVASIGRALSQVPGQITITGHTNQQPPNHELYRNNFELSALRAVSVANILMEQHGIPPKRITVQGVGDTQPIAPKNDPANRRVEITIMQGKASQEDEMLNDKGQLVKVAAPTMASKAKPEPKAQSAAPTNLVNQPPQPTMLSEDGVMPPPPPILKDGQPLDN